MNIKTLLNKKVSRNVEYRIKLTSRINSYSKSWIRRIGLFSPLIIGVFVLESKAINNQNLDHLVVGTSKDTVVLSDVQTKQINAFNREEQQVGNKYNRSDSFSFHRTKMVEKRDAVYKSILSADKYQLFKQGKIVIINSDNIIIRD